MARNVSVTVDLFADDRIAVLSQRADQYGPALVVLSLGELRLSVRADNLAVLDALGTAAVEARDWLIAEVAGQTRLPVEAEPVGDTGLTLHPLPVGMA